MNIFKYIVTVKHDAGRARIHTTGSSIAEVVEQVMDMERCPERAILKVERGKQLV